jgi:hypothetical protein
MRVDLYITMSPLLIRGRCTAYLGEIASRLGRIGCVREASGKGEKVPEVVTNPGALLI